MPARPRPAQPLPGVGAELLAMSRGDDHYFACRAAFLELGRQKLRRKTPESWIGGVRGKRMVCGVPVHYRNL